MLVASNETTRRLVIVAGILVILAGISLVTVAAPVAASQMRRPPRRTVHKAPPPKTTVKPDGHILTQQEIDRLLGVDAKAEKDAAEERERRFQDELRHNGGLTPSEVRRRDADRQRQEEQQQALRQQAEEAQLREQWEAAEAKKAGRAEREDQLINVADAADLDFMTYREMSTQSLANSRFLASIGVRTRRSAVVSIKPRRIRRSP